MTDQTIIRAYRELAHFAQHVIPSFILSRNYEPTIEDGKDLVSDLVILARRVDAVVKAYGDYCESYGIVSPKDVKNLFTDQLLGSLEGNALYAIESGVEELIAANREARREYEYENRMDR